AASDHDLPAQTLTFSLSGAPTGASIDPSTGVFSWTPAEAQGPGVYNFNVVVSDGSFTDTKPIQLTVAEVNVAPILSGVPASASINEEELYTFTASASDHDLPAQTLSYSLTGAPSGAAISSSTGVFTDRKSVAQGHSVHPLQGRVRDR